jgi:lipopolysaccharide export system permease protein
VRLLDRYLIRELLVLLGFCLGGFAVCWLAFDLFGQLAVLQEHKLHGDEILLYELCRLPSLLTIVLPVSLLLALLRALTLHTRHHEFTAMRAAGISLWRICAPYLFVGFVGSGILFIVNETLAPLATEKAIAIRESRVSTKAANQSLFQKIVFANERNGTVWEADYNPRTGAMRDVHVRWKKPDGSQFLLSASTATFVQDVWNFTDVQAETQLPGRGSIFSVNRIFQKQLVVPEFKDTPQQINDDLEISRLANKTHVEQAQIPLNRLARNLRNSHLTERERLYVLTQIHGRFAAPWVCFVVVLIAIPFGAAGGRRNVFFGVAGSIFICFAFFILQEIGLALGVNGHVAPWLGAWLPNILFGVGGAALIFRVR